MSGPNISVQGLLPSRRLRGKSMMFESCSMLGKTIIWNFRHAHTHAHRGAHTHGHTYMHRHAYTNFIHLYSRNDDTRGRGHFLHSESRQMTWTKMSWTRLSTTADAGMQTGWSSLDSGKRHERLKKSLLWVRRLWRLRFVAMLWSIATFYELVAVITRQLS